MSRRRRSSLSSSSSFLSPPLLILLLPILTLLFIFLLLPPFLSFTSHLLRPTSVKKSWDSLNVFFVAFAILCGVFARRDDDDDEESSATTAESGGEGKSVEEEEGNNGSSSVSRNQWYGFSDSSSPIMRFQSSSPSPANGVLRLRRSSSSYPDLRQETLWETPGDRYRFRFFDDYEIHKFRSPARDQIPVNHLSRRRGDDGEDVEVKEIQVDTFETRSSSPLPNPPSPSSSPPQQQPVPMSPVSPPTPPPPPPPPPPVSARPRSRRVYQSVPRKEIEENVKEIDGDTEITGNRSPPPPPPAPPPPSVQVRSDYKRGRSERRRSNVKREIAMVWASVLSKSNQKKKKNQRTKKSNNHILDEDNDNAEQPPPPM